MEFASLSACPKHTDSELSKTLLKGIVGLSKSSKFDVHINIQILVDLWLASNLTIQI